jgi:fatty-acyl-CoA synthase
LPPARKIDGHDDMYYKIKAGRVVAGVEVRVVAEDGTILPHDGESVGEFEIRGPWVTGSYYKDEDPAKFDGGWLRTGDVGTLDHQGYMTISDRTKDVIKSGGEWISSVELENAVMAHPDVLEAAVIAIPDDKWSERPLVAVVAKPGRSPAPSDLVAFLAERGVHRSWLPHKWTLISEVPKTSVGKFDKKVMRAAYAKDEYEVVNVELPK